MKIPKKMQKILQERTKAAQKFMACDAELVQWMESAGVDINSDVLRDHISGGCESIVNPKLSEDLIIQFLSDEEGERK